MAPLIGKDEFFGHIISFAAQRPCSIPLLTLQPIASQVLFPISQTANLHDG
jgi:hypothetical protein